MTERILLHITAYLTDAGTLRKFRNRWRQMPAHTRERFIQWNRVLRQIDPRKP